MSRFQLRIIFHTEKQEDLKLNVKRQSMHVNTKMTEISQLPHKDFKAAIMKVLQ